MTRLHLIAILLASLVISADANSQSSDTRLPADASTPVGLKLEMRKLWSDRVFWTRAYMIAALNNAPDAEVCAKRLTRTDEDLAHTLSVFYGEAGGPNLLRTFHDQSSTLISLARAAKVSAGTVGTSASDPSNMGPLLEQWHHSRETIGAALQAGNTTGSSPGISDALQSYLSATMKELEAQANKDWPADIHAFDEARDAALRVADETSDRIAAAFPQRFTRAAVTSGIR